MDEHTEIYEKLAGHLGRHPEGFPRTETGVEIRILRRLFTPEEAALALFLTLMPEHPAAVAARNGLDPVDTARKLEEMSRKGLIFRIGKPGEFRYMIVPFAIGIWEYHVNDLDPELIRDVHEYLPDYFKQSTQINNPQIRTIPVSRALKVEQAIMPYEEAHRIIAGKNKIVVAPCICRRERKIMGSGCDRLPEACLVFGSAAWFYEQNGLGRSIAQQEALDILDQAEKAGLVLQPTNNQSVDNICACCGCCCGVLSNLKKLPEPAEHAASNYFATIDREQCIGCGTCLDRCQMDAIEMEDESASILRKRCIGCGLCVTTCPQEAIRLQEKPEAEKSIPPLNAMERLERITMEQMARRDKSRQ